MKQRYFIGLLGFFLSINLVQAQFDCSNGRYYEEVFSDFTLTSDITYGQAVNVNGLNQSLSLDLYQPEGDTLSQRPLLILAHGGSFIFGSKTGTDVVPLCLKYVKLGYVVASIQYRLGFEGFLPNPNSATRTVYRAACDMKAAIRFFRKDAATANLYKIHPDYIFTGGVSAGAFTALHAQYLNETAEIPSAVNPDDFGGIEGNSGNEGFSSASRAVVNLCGAIGDSSWIVSGDVPCLSMHGTEDGTVPYGTDVISVLGISLITVDGSASIARRLDNLGNTESVFVSWAGADHVPFVASAAYRDSVFQYMTPFLASQLGCLPTGIESLSGKHAEVLMFPNPAVSQFEYSADKPMSEIQVFDSNGRKVIHEKSLLSRTGSVSLQQLNAGIYWVTFLLESGEQIHRKLIVP